MGSHLISVNGVQKKDYILLIQKQKRVGVGVGVEIINEESMVDGCIVYK